MWPKDSGSKVDFGADLRLGLRASEFWVPSLFLVSARLQRQPMRQEFLRVEGV